MTWDRVLTIFDHVVRAVGPPFAIFLVIFVLLWLLAILYMLLHFGENAFAKLLEYLSLCLKILWKEGENTHNPAIRLEYGLHIGLFALLILSLALIVLYSLIPWIEAIEKAFFYAIGVTALFCILYISRMSIKLMLRFGNAEAAGR
jgi:hypothetical protein